MPRTITVREEDLAALLELRKQLIQQDHRFATWQIVQYAEAIGRVAWAPDVKETR